MKRIALPRFVVRSTFIAVSVAVAAAALAAPAQSSQGQILGSDNPDAIPGRYIVVFDNQDMSPAGTKRKIDALKGEHGGKVRHVYDAALRGYAATMSKRQAAAIARAPGVDYVQQAHYMYAIDTQSDPPNWGDDRIDQADLPLDRAYNYPTDPGKGAHVYVVDSGVNTSHSDFTGRVGTGADFVDGDSTPQDCNGHGTHVAGTAVGTTYGVAKKATLHAVRVLNCEGSGSSDAILAGLDWVRGNASSPAVINFSIGCRQRCSDPTWDQAARDVIASGVTFVQAAGNSNDDACYYSPQKVAEGITVGNSTSSDAKAQSSSWGTCLDLWAPGTDIVSTSNTSNTGTKTMSGTSMASPHVAGAAAVYLGQNPQASPRQVQSVLVDNATPNTLTGVFGSPNLLLYTGFMNDGGSTPPPDNSGCSGSNDSNVQIEDNATVTSSISISGCDRAASASSEVEVHIEHTFRGDLVIDLVAPDGSAYRLKNSNPYDNADNVDGTVTIDLSSEPADGEWKLRVQDVAANDTGYIDSWALTP